MFLHIFSSVIESPFFWDMPLCHWEIGAPHFETIVFIKMLGTGHPVMQHHILEVLTRPDLWCPQALQNVGLS
jgi:hypothetical protein